MRYDSERHHRRSIRLKGYDYRQVGGYFITLVTQDRACLFGEVVDGEMRLNEYGQIAWEEWFRSAEIRREIRLYPDEFVVMPNHIHGIVWIAEPHVGAHGGAPNHHPAGTYGGAPNQSHPPAIVGTRGGAPDQSHPPAIVGTRGGAPDQSHPPAIVGAHGRAPLQRPPRSLSSFIGGYKSAVTKRINVLRGVPGAPVWQRNYYEHIIRNEDDLEAIRHYILTNPSRWHEDRENPHSVGANPSV